MESIQPTLERVLMDIMKSKKRIETDEEAIERMIFDCELPKPGVMYHFWNEGAKWSRPVLILGFYLEHSSAFVFHPPLVIVKFLEDDEVRLDRWNVFSSYWRQVVQ